MFKHFNFYNNVIISNKLQRNYFDLMYMNITCDVNIDLENSNYTWCPNFLDNFHFIKMIKRILIIYPYVMYLVILTPYNYFLFDLTPIVWKCSFYYTKYIQHLLHYFIVSPVTWNINKFVYFYTFLLLLLFIINNKKFNINS